MAETSPLVNVQIDGVWHQFPKGTRVIEACAQLGIYIPRYCYHPKLSSPGNCRMCLIEMGLPRMGPDRKFELGADGKPLINWMPRPQICCAQDVAEGMGVRTSSPLVEECRRGVMEFLLINHPLDCPICDQAGECRLQEFSVEYGRADSRFLEGKVKKPKGPDWSAGHARRRALYPLLALHSILPGNRKGQCAWLHRTGRPHYSDGASRQATRK